MEKYTNDSGNECYRGATSNSEFSPDLFHNISMPEMSGDTQFALHTNLGTLTVLHRLTGFTDCDGYRVRDTETGFRDQDGNFWLASGMNNVLLSNSKTIGEAVNWIKERANTCVPDLAHKGG